MLMFFFLTCQFFLIAFICMLMILFTLKSFLITLFGMCVFFFTACHFIRKRRSDTAREPKDTAGNENGQSKNKRHCASPAGLELIQPYDVVLCPVLQFFLLPNGQALNKTLPTI